MAGTPNAGLPLIEPNMTADVPRDFNALANALDAVIGEMESVTTAAKDVAGAITELHAAIQDVDVDIPDGSVTPEKLSFDPATQAELDAHVNAITVHGATSAATASRLIIRDANGRAKVAAPSATDDIALLSSITKTQVGLASVDNYGTATQAEAEAGTATNKFMTPQRTKQAIDKFTGGVPLRVNAGQLEFYDGTGWQTVGGGFEKYPNANTLVIPSTSYPSLTPLLNVTGKKGYLNRAFFLTGNPGSGGVPGQRFRVILDGVAVIDMTYTAPTSSAPVGFATGGDSKRSPSNITSWSGLGYAVAYPLTATLANPGVSFAPSELYFNTSLRIEVMTAGSNNLAGEISYATN